MPSSLGLSFLFLNREAKVENTEEVGKEEKWGEMDVDVKCLSNSEQMKQTEWGMMMGKTAHFLFA